MRLVEYIGTIEEDDCIKQYTSVVICGCGKTGKKVADYLRKVHSLSIDCFFDSNITIQDTYYRNIPIMSYENGTVNNAALFLVTNLDVRKTVKHLLNNGIRKIHIIRP